MIDILGPAIKLAEEGFPVAPVSAAAWEAGVAQLRTGPHANEMLLTGHAPRAGEIMKLPTLAKTFREVAEHGKKGFYEGRIAQAIVDVIRQRQCRIKPKPEMRTKSLLFFFVFFCSFFLLQLAES